MAPESADGVSVGAFGLSVAQGACAAARSGYTKRPKCESVPFILYVAPQLWTARVLIPITYKIGTHEGKNVTKPKKLPKVLTEAEQGRLLDQLNIRYRTPHRNLCMIHLMLDAGLRVGEVVALKPEHVNIQICKVMVREGKGAKDREIWIGQDLRDLIGKWLERRPESEWLFPTRHGTKVNTRYMRAAVKRYARKAGTQEWEKVSPHTLRHTFATDLLNQTGNIRLVQETLGHTDVSTTMIYTHVNSAEIRDAMQTLRKRRARG